MFSSLSLRGLLTRKAATPAGSKSRSLSVSPSAAAKNAKTTVFQISSTTESLITSASRLFSTTSAAMTRKQPRKASGPSKAPIKPFKNTPVRRSRQPGRSDSYRRVAILKQNMFSPAPPPLRMARQRHLRHWTIHRAWLLFRRQQDAAVHEERSRMASGMFNACEALRKTVGPGHRGEGYLYRVAMEKKGVWGMNAVPIEYARFQTENPAKQAWDHGWKR
jgi:large subunit ribosomal protein L40